MPVQQAFEEEKKFKFEMKPINSPPNKVAFKAKPIEEDGTVIKPPNPILTYKAIDSPSTSNGSSNQPAFAIKVAE